MVTWQEYNGQLVWRFIHQKICFNNELDKPENGPQRHMHANARVRVHVRTRAYVHAPVCSGANAT